MSGKKNSLLLILFLLAFLIGISIYAFKQKADLNELNVVHQELKTEYNLQLTELEKVKNKNSDLESKLADQEAIIAKLKKQIGNLAYQKRLKAKQVVELTKKLTRFGNEIEQYKARIVELEEQVAQLQSQNQALSSENTVLSEEKEILEQRVNEASQIKAINLSSKFVKKTWFFGTSEKPTTNPDKVTKAVLSFFLQNNFLAENGTKEIYVAIIQPNEEVLVDKDLQSGEVTLQGKTFKYTEKITVNYDKTKSNEIVTTFEPDTTPMQAGQYEVLVYDYMGAIISDRANFSYTLVAGSK